MDPLTHILFGNACALCAVRRTKSPSGESLRILPVATLAALFPDIDYLGFWVDPLVFLADWHRGYTHSLVLLPFWAGLVSLPFMLSSAYRSHWRLVYVLCCLVLTSHILLDLITVYGTQILAPLSDTRYSFAITFVIDPLVTLPLLLALVLGRWLPLRPLLAVCLLYLGGYWCTQYVLKQYSLERVAVGLPAGSELYAIPQPFSPFNWKLIQPQEGGYRMAYLNLLAKEDAAGWLERLGVPVADYRPPEALQWRIFTRFGEEADQRATAKQVWQLSRLDPFRRFALFPALYRYDQNADGSCVWFTDLRYALPFMPPPFRYGACRAGAQAPWRVYRLRRFEERAGEPLFSS